MKIASGGFTVSQSGAVTPTMSAGSAAVSRVGVGRYRITFASPQADLAYRAISDCRDPTLTITCRVYAKTTTYFEVIATQITLVLITTADPAEVFYDVERLP